jgi:hypothetical protein
MIINENKLINVLNYNENPVAIKTHVREYLCQAAENDTPSITPLTFSEIESLNSNSNAFKIGTLRFPSDTEAEIYEALRITDWEEILTNKDIEDIILHPSLSGLTKLIAINNVQLFERVRGVFFSLKNTNQYDISTRVEKIVVTRYKELCNRQIKTGIVLSTKDTSTTVPSEEVNALKEQNIVLQEKMLQMQKMIEQMIAMQTASATKTTEENINDEVVNVEPKKAGRPPSKK